MQDLLTKQCSLPWFSQWPVRPVRIIRCSWFVFTQISSSTRSYLLKRHFCIIRNSTCKSRRGGTLLVKRHQIFQSCLVTYFRCGDIPNNKISNNKVITNLLPSFQVKRIFKNLLTFGKVMGKSTKTSLICSDQWYAFMMSDCNTTVISSGTAN